MALALITACLLSGCAVERLLMPAPTLEAGADKSGSPPAALNILFATDRKPKSNKDRSTGSAASYDSGRSRSLAFGNARIELTARDAPFAGADDSTQSKRYVMQLANAEEYGRDPPVPWPAVENDGFMVDSPKVLATAAAAVAPFVQDIKARLARSSVKDVYVYVHGVGNTFEDAALTMAEIWNFLDREGVPILYTWPAGREGLLQAYGYDRESSEFTIFHMKRTLRLLAQIPQVERIHLIAHSRGTDVVVSALRELVIETVAARQNPHEQLRIHNVILAAPDLDVEVLIQRSAAERLSAYIARLTIYTTREDKAIGLAELVFGSIIRLGRAGANDLATASARAAATAKNIALVEYTGDHTGAFGHDYFRTNRAVVADMVLAILGDRQPGTAEGRPLKHLGGVFWQLDDSYSARVEALCKDHRDLCQH